MSDRLSVEQAQKRLLDTTVRHPQIEYIKLDQAYNRILAQEVVAGIDVPSTDNSAMDGFALHTDSLKTLPVTLRRSLRITAGEQAGILEANCAARIFTGAELPQGANCVVIQENCHFDDDTVTLKAPAQAGDNIRRAGQDIHKNQTLFQKGRRLSVADVGLIASIGLAEVPVYKTLKVVILNSGDELTEPGIALKPGELYNSNRYLLNSLVKTLGITQIESIHLPDDREKTKQALLNASSQADIILTSGGVSVGEEDHIRHAVETLGAVDFWKINLKPGKPMMFGHIENTPIVGLPGNPVSCFVTFLLFACPFLKHLNGEHVKLSLAFRLPIQFSIKKARKRDEYLRVMRTEKGLVPFSNQSSGVLSSLAYSDGLALIPEGKTLDNNDFVNYYPYSLLLKP